MTWLLALLVKPFVVLALIFCVFTPIIYSVKRWMPEGRMKRLLLLRIGGPEQTSG